MEGYFWFDDGGGNVTIGDAEQYTVLFSSCHDDVEVTMDVHTEMYNVPRPGGYREYLPVSLLPLLGIFAASSVVYFTFLAAWMFVCIKQCATVERIHMPSWARCCCLRP
ncbi:hypothetical protein ZWY2020_052997 [Hordeum vulgare]|nr:hypothetical protein ZWY2020_052997 [Hordeum vulgare]